MERDLRSQIGSERGLVEEYVEKMPNPSLKGERGRGLPAAPAGPGPAALRPGLCRQSPSLSPCSVQTCRPG